MNEKKIVGQWLQQKTVGCGISPFFSFFFNRRYSLLSFDGTQLYNSEALPFTYGQYVVIELADKLLLFFCALRKYVFHLGLKREPNVD